MSRFWDGFEKQALHDTRLKEDLAVAGSAALPFGTTLHTMNRKGGDRGVEWLSRLLGGTVGGIGGYALGSLKGPTAAGLGGILGESLGEVAASRLVHQDKYKDGKLKPGKNS